MYVIWRTEVSFLKLAKFLKLDVEIIPGTDLHLREIRIISLKNKFILPDKIKKIHSEIWLDYINRQYQENSNFNEVIYFIDIYHIICQHMHLFSETHRIRPLFDCFQKWTSRCNIEACPISLCFDIYPNGKKEKIND